MSDRALSTHFTRIIRGIYNRVKRWCAGPCIVCGTRHAWFIERDGKETAYCPRVPGNSRNRYLPERREIAARGVATGNLNDVVFDDLLLAYGSRRGLVEAMCAEPRPRRVESIAGPLFDTETVQHL